MQETHKFQELIEKSLKTDKLLFSASFEVPSHGIKKNNKTIRFARRRSGDVAMGKSKYRPFIANTDKQTSAEEYMVLELSRHTRRMGADIPISDPLHAVFFFVYPSDVFYTKKGRVSKNLPDLSNLYEMPQDALTKAGIIEDDYLICSHDGSRRMPGDKYELHIFLFRYLGKEWR
jgi:Holliday junction resolvase RusA-like endonuclease